ncbi:MAG: hypothetical protein LBJ71_03755, partial [Holosporaceae bacterium]|nr:hypothetical protein [Holosporaceae bacterium]
VAFVLVAASPIDPVQANVGQVTWLSLSEAKRAQLVEHWGSATPFWERYWLSRRRILYLYSYRCN